jgi:hypothetical protein
MRRSTHAAIGALTLLGAAAVIAPSSGVDASTGADVSNPAVTRVAVDSTPRPWLHNPKISERDGGGGWGWYVGWTKNSQKRPHHYNAYYRESDSGVTGRLNARGTEGALGVFFADWVTYTQWGPGQSGDVFMAGQDGWPKVRFPRKVNTPAKEFQPTLSRDWLMFTRYNSGTDTHRVMLYNRATKRLRTLDRASGRAAVFAGQVRGDWATWYTWGPKHSNVFLYQISRRTTVKIPRRARFARQHHSSVAADGTLYYQRRTGRACGRSPELVMNPLAGPPKVLYRYPAGKDGARLVLDPPGAWGAALNITVITCGRPSTRSADVYAMEPPSNPFPTD